MGLYHSTYRAYGFEIPTTTDFEDLDRALADQPQEHRVQYTCLGDFERLFLLAVCEEIEPNAFATVTPMDFLRRELPVWNTVLHHVAVRLGHTDHPDPTWLVLHDHS